MTGCWLLVLFSFISSCGKRTPDDSFDEVHFSFHERNFGASADELLKGDKFTLLTVEIQYMKGFKPDSVAVANLKSFLMTHLNKPSGIVFFQKEIEAVGDTVLSAAQVYRISKKNRAVYTGAKRIAIYILYTNGHFQNPRILAHAFRSTSIVIYGKPVKEYEDVFSFPSQTTIETNLLLHEMGHLLGLVDKGSNMTSMHADSGNKAHCINPDCVMYWAVGIKPEFGPLLPHKIKFFDTACLNDLKANGGK